MKRLRVRLTQRAREQGLRISAWWHEHRPLAPELFDQELSEALQLLALHPMTGIPHESKRVPHVRRFLLRGSRYHVYYRVFRDEVVVRSIWSAIRGSGPDLRGIRNT